MFVNVIYLMISRVHHNMPKYWRWILLCELKKCNGAFPNLSADIRIMLISITLAGTEESFLKLQSIKNDLRSSLWQDHLSGQVILAIENDESENVNYIIDHFASKMSRKMNFK